MGIVQASAEFDNNENIFFVPNRFCIDETVLKSILIKSKVPLPGGSRNFFENQQRRLSKVFQIFPT